jgi:Rrf2 family cysteine metabolism transcriptional repressor
VVLLVEVRGGGFGAGAESVFAEPAAAARAILQNATISDVVERENRAAGAHMYYI